MTCNFEEGESINVPCRHCASLSIQLEIHAGAKTFQCPKCKGQTTVQVIRQGDDDWKILTEASEVKI